jgi:hypothetical protein
MAIVKKQVKTKFYTALRPVSDTDKVPPQAKLIVKTLLDAGGKLFSDELIKLLSRKPEDGGLVTNQTPKRILGFYKPKLSEIGILQEEVETTEVDTEVPDRPRSLLLLPVRHQLLRHRPSRPRSARVRRLLRPESSP